MINLLIWVVYGLIVGLISKAIFRDKDIPTGFLATLTVGVCGSFIGGFVNYCLSGGDALQPSGVVMGVLGGVVTCFLYRKFFIEK